ncbi:MAG: FtsX-like permease family protein [Bacteroidales bacterium]|nr:FtsX-like permease family protein [Bacteroidales bacterium]
MKSYLRFLSRNKLYTAIEVVGLSVALAFVILMSCFVWQQRSVGRQYPDFKSIYCAGYYNTTFSSVRFSNIISGQIPGIEQTVNIVRYEGLMDESIGIGTYLAVSSGFFDMFPCRFIAGNHDVLDDASNVIITESMAEKFGGMDALGKDFHINNERYTIGAIIEDHEYSIFDSQYRIFVSLDHPDFDFFKNTDEYKGSADGNSLTFHKVRKGADVGEIRKRMNEINDSYLIREEDKGKEYYNLIRLDKLYFSDSNQGQGLKRGNAMMMKVFSIIAIFLLISAIFNYINLSTALAGKRGKEMATRMLLGDSRQKVMGIYIKESLLMTFMCICLAFLIAKACLPYINRLIDSPVPVAISFSPSQMILYLLILIVTGLSCGIIPGIISFRFRPIDTLKGSFRYHSKKTFSKIFIIIQDCIAIIMIAVSLIMGSQIRHMMDMPVQADIDSLYRCNTRTFDPGFEQKLRGLPYVSDIGKTYGRPCGNALNNIVPLDENFTNLVNLGEIHCDAAAFRMYGFEVVRDYGKPGMRGAWLTEGAAQALGMNLDDPVLPRGMDRMNQGFEVAGIIRDFALRTAINLIENEYGVVYVYDKWMPFAGDYIVKMNSISKENLKELEEISAEEARYNFGPNVRVSSGLLEDLIKADYAQTRNQLAMVNIFMVIAIMLSVLGQVAMSTYYASEREKEIGIRKVFGGTVRSESARNIREYMLYCLIAAVVAIPAAWVIAGRYLEDFAYRMPQKAWIYIAAAAAVAAISLLAVLWQTLRAARTNPAEALKKE